MDHGTTTRQATEASDSSALDTAPVAPVAGSGAERRLIWRYTPNWLPLVAVLAVQAALSIRLVRADTAFEDEATYLWAGHLEWANWLHGTPIPQFSAYFSGAPFLYPPLGALADSIGGLTAARILSLVFMLGATALLWGATSRLYGRRAAFFAAALFAVSGPTLHLGSFATYDAMSVFLVALAACLVLRAGDRGDAAGRMIVAGVVLALANAAAYSTILFDPIVILLVLLSALPKPGGGFAARRIGLLLIALVTPLLAAVLIGGSSYIGGFEKTTLARAVGAASPSTVLLDSWEWTGITILLALGGIIVGLVNRLGRARVWVLVILTVAAILGPLEQANLHTSASLNKHVGLGAWFAAIAAGYAADWFISAAPAGRNRILTCAACVVALAFPISLGVTQSYSFATSWANADSFIAIMRPTVGQSNGRLLVEDPTIAEYYLGVHDWQLWSSTRNIIEPSGKSTGGPSPSAGVVGGGNVGVFSEFIDDGYFSVIALNFADTTALDHSIAADIKRNRHYHIVQVVPYGVEVPPIGLGTYIIWKYEK